MYGRAAIIGCTATMFVTTDLNRQLHSSVVGDITAGHGLQPFAVERTFWLFIRFFNSATDSTTLCRIGAAKGFAVSSLYCGALPAPVIKTIRATNAAWRYSALTIKTNGVSGATL